MNSQQLHEAVLQTSETLARLLQGLTVEQLDQQPPHGGWTAGQVAEHILRAAQGMTDGLRGRVAPTTRDPEEKIALLQSIFLDFSTKMTSPDFVAPIETVHPKDGLINSLAHVFDRLQQGILSLDLTATCLDAALPRIGDLTRKECACFVLFHTQRHVHQLQGVIQNLSPAVAAVA